MRRGLSLLVAATLRAPLGLSMPQALSAPMALAAPKTLAAASRYSVALEWREAADSRAALVMARRTRRRLRRRRARDGAGVAWGHVGSRAAAAAPLRYGRHVFTCEVRLGDDQPPVAALVDTGSSNLVVPSDACISTGCRGHRHFKPQDDPSGHFLGPELSDLTLRYASGHLGGSGFESRVCLGSSICGRGRFIVAAFESDDFLRFPFDGILGLGLPSQAAGPGFSLLDELARQGVIPSRSFALALRTDGNATLTFAPDAQAMYAAGVLPEALAWFEADARHGEWAVDVQNVRLGSQGLGDACDGPRRCRAAVDSGSAGIVLPGPLARAAQGQLSDLGDCSADALAALPSLTFTLSGGHVFEVPPVHYVEISPVDPSRCRLLIQAMDSNDVVSRTIILGQAFLLERYAVFNQSGPKVGLAPLLRAGQS